jgi:hypothetical protein
MHLLHNTSKLECDRDYNAYHRCVTCCRFQLHNFQKSALLCNSAHLYNNITLGLVNFLYKLMEKSRVLNTQSIGWLGLLVVVVNSSSFVV